MKILCVIDSLCSGGSQRQLVELALALKEKQHAVSLLTYHQAEFFLPPLETNGIKVTCLVEPNYMKRLMKMRRYIRKGGYDAVISFLEGPSAICELSGLPSRKWKLIVGERSANPGIFKSSRLRFYRWLHFFADFVVANSHTNMEIIRSVNSFLPDSKCRVIYNLTNLDEWKPLSDYRPRENGKITLVVAASHQYLKNLNGLLEALSLLPKEDLNKINVEWYGERLEEPYIDGSLPEAREKIKKEHLESAITLFPVTDAIKSNIQRADVVGLFSFYEGFPNAVCEAMACAKPVICSSVSDIPAILSYDQKLFFDPKDATCIRDTLAYVLNLNNEQLLEIGAQNRRIAAEMFDREIIVDKYLDLLTA